MNEMQFFSNERCFPNPKFLLWGFYKKQADRPLHKQEFAEIVFVVSGESDYLTAQGEGKVEHISRGSILIVPEGGMHGYCNSRDLKIFALLFTPSHLPLLLYDLYSQPSYQQVFGRKESYYESVRKNYPRLDLGESDFAEFEHLLEHLVHFQNSTTPGSSCKRLGIFTRTEGMSYGMMMCVQMNRKDIFDKLWTFSERYMLIKEGRHQGYFRWSVHTDGSANSGGPAPDGEEYFAMALFMAAARWGDSEGSFNYTLRAQEILRHAVHQHEMVNGGEPMWVQYFNKSQQILRMSISDIV